MTSEEVMELIQGDTPMATKLYAELTREEVEKLLQLHNVIADILSDVSDIFDIRMSQLAELQTQMYVLKNIFDFKPQKSEECDHPAHWKPYVLKDDDRAWYYQGATN